MNLLLTFLVSVAVAIFALSWVGVIIDRYTSSFTSLLIYFPLFFLTIFAVWKFSVKITEPKSGTTPSTTA